MGEEAETLWQMPQQNAQKNGPVLSNRPFAW